ncbi:hypothetical protein HZS_4224, partial [Henneguya salminicola]
MSDYWKSNPIRFCELCKSYYTDNKRTNDIHEKGRRHQENLKKKIETSQAKIKCVKTKDPSEKSLEKLKIKAINSMHKNSNGNEEFMKKYESEATKLAKHQQKIKFSKKKPESKKNYQITSNTLHRDNIEAFHQQTDIHPLLGGWQTVFPTSKPSENTSYENKIYMEKECKFNERTI